MKISTGSLAMLLLAAAGTASAAQFDSQRMDERRIELRQDSQPQNSQPQGSDRHDGDRDDHQRGNRDVVPHANVQTAPEISAGSMIAALTLLGGALIVFRSRRKPLDADRA